MGSKFLPYLQTRFCLAILAAGSLLFLSLFLFKSEAAPTAPSLSGTWQLVFQDEFDGSSLDRNKWVTCWHWGTMNGGCNNNPGGRMLSWMFDRNVSVSDGALQLRTVKENYTTPWDNRTYNWTSGMVTTDRLDGEGKTNGRFAFKYGYMEARMKLPSAKGIYSAFWTTAEDHSWPPEIDVFERIGDRGDLYHLTHHWPNGTSGGGSLTQEYVDSKFNDGNWHTFAALWDPEKIVWYLDGREITRYTNKDNIPAKNLVLLLSAEVWSQSSGWTSGPDSSTPNVTTTYVDYVRVWQRTNGATVPLSNPSKVSISNRFGTWGLNGDTYDKATDGNTGTAFDAGDATNCHTGIDAGSNVTVDMVRYWPRLWQGKRMIGGKFQGSSSQSGPWTDLYTIKYWPPDGSFTTAKFSNSQAYRYYRYVGPVDGHCNIMEMEFRTGTNGGGVTTQSLSNGTYKVVSRVVDKVMDVYKVSADNGAKIQIWTYGGGNNQRWQVEKQSDGTYRLTAVHSGKVLEVPGGSGADNVQLVQASWTGDSRQRFYIEHVGNGYYQIKNVRSGKCVDLKSSGTANGTPVQQYFCNGTNAQQWKFSTP
jgi:beta-glucanase (GH16 family)